MGSMMGSKAERYQPFDIDNQLKQVEAPPEPLERHDSRKTSRHRALASSDTNVDVPFHSSKPLSSFHRDWIPSSERRWPQQRRGDGHVFLQVRPQGPRRGRVCRQVFAVRTPAGLWLVFSQLGQTLYLAFCIVCWSLTISWAQQAPWTRAFGCGMRLCSRR